MFSHTQSFVKVLKVFGFERTLYEFLLLKWNYSTWCGKGCWSCCSWTCWRRCFTTCWYTKDCSCTWTCRCCPLLWGGAGWIRSHWGCCPWKLLGAGGLISWCWGCLPTGTCWWDCWGLPWNAMEKYKVYKNKSKSLKISVFLPVG